MKKFLVTALILIIAGFSNAESFDAKSLFTRGNDFYQQKDYIQAADTYHKIINEGTISYQVYYNLGCCYFRMNDHANARLYFETALKFKAGDKDIQKNIQILKTQLKDKIETHEQGIILKSYESFLHLFSLNSLSILLLITLSACFLFTALIISGRFELKPVLYGLGTSIILFILVLSLFISRHKTLNMAEAVVFRSEINVYSEPSSGSSLLFKLHSGTKTIIEDEQQGFYHISLENGMNGWADKENLKKIELNSF